MNILLKRLFFLLICVASFSTLEAKTKYKHPLAVCAIFRNEARFLKEWIEFHKLMGATRFYLYNNLSDDNYYEVLQPYIETGEVELFLWPYKFTTIESWTTIQVGAYNNAVGRAIKAKVKWLAVLDTDEFLFPVHAENLVTFLKDFSSVGGVVANWQLFGTSHVERIPSDQLMIELLTLKAETKYAENAFVKSIVRPERVKQFTDPHYAEYLNPYQAVSQNKNSVHSSMNNSIPVDKLRINHYWSRDLSFFTEIKMPRRQAWLEGADGQWQRLANINQVQDYTIKRFIPALKEKMSLQQR